MTGSRGIVLAGMLVSFAVAGATVPPPVVSPQPFVRPEIVPIAAAENRLLLGVRATANGNLTKANPLTGGPGDGWSFSFTGVSVGFGLVNPDPVVTLQISK